MSSYTIGEILLWLLAAAVLGFVLGWLVRELVLRRRHRPSSTAPGSVIPEPATPEVVVPAIEPGPHAGSALPLDGGESPSPDYVVKVSKGSKIFHAPSSPAYGRTTEALWFETPEAAEAAGYRRPKNG